MRTRGGGGGGPRGCRTEIVEGLLPREDPEELAVLDRGSQEVGKGRLLPDQLHKLLVRLDAHGAHGGGNRDVVAAGIGGQGGREVDCEAPWRSRKRITTRNK